MLVLFIAHAHTHTRRECIFYTNQLCAEYIHRDWSVFSDNTTAFYESHITDIMDLSSNFSTKCVLFIKSIVCHRIYPYCNPFTVGVGGFSPLQICHQTCRELKSVCGEEIKNFGDKRLSTILFQNCTDDSPEAGDKPGCIFVYADRPLKGVASCGVTILLTVLLYMSYGLRTTLHTPSSPHRWAVQ